MRAVDIPRNDGMTPLLLLLSRRGSGALREGILEIEYQIPSLPQSPQEIRRIYSFCCNLHLSSEDTWQCPDFLLSRRGSGALREGILEILLEKGVDVNRRDERGNTALTLCAQNFSGYSGACRQPLPQ